MVTFVALIVLILLHELGHFVAARRFGVKVEEFGIGLPPKALTLAKRGETEYTLNWLPLGGFVRLFGEDNDLSVFQKLNPFTKKRSFISKPAWQRVIILLAGIFMNFLIGVVIFSVIYSLSGVPHTERNVAVVIGVAKDSPAALAGMKPGDAIVQIDDVTIDGSASFVEVVGNKKGQALSFWKTPLLPDGTMGETREIVQAIPRVNPPEGEGSLGVSVATIPIVRYEKKPWYVAPFYGVVNGTREAWEWGKQIGKSVPSLFGNIFRGRIPEGTTGIVGVIRQGNEIADTSGVMGLLRFTALLSINLAIFNLLPIPGLDGGRLLFVGLEKIFGRHRTMKYENYIHSAGIIFLIGLMLVITWKDIWG